MNYYVVLDTNVIVSALLSKNEDSATVQILNSVFENKIKLLFSLNIKKEYKEVLNRDKFGFQKPTINYLLKTIDKYGILIDPVNKCDESLPDINDLPFYEILIQTRKYNSYLITGNTKHFPKKPFIVTPREFLNIINNG